MAEVNLEESRRKGRRPRSTGAEKEATSKKVPCFSSHPLSRQRKLFCNNKPCILCVVVKTKEKIVMEELGGRLLFRDYHLTREGRNSSSSGKKVGVKKRRRDCCGSCHIRCLSVYRGRTYAGSDCGRGEFGLAAAGEKRATASCGKSCPEGQKKTGVCRLTKQFQTDTIAFFSSPFFNIFPY